MNSPVFKAGFAQTDITPTLGTIINGDFVQHYAVSIHDPLYSKAMVLGNDTTRVALVVVDICVMKQDFVDEVKQIVCKTLPLEYENILISSTHTHAAGSVADVHLSAPDMLYRQKLPALIARSVADAFRKMIPAKVAFGSVPAPEHVLCRRYFMNEGYDPVNPVSGNTDAVKTNPFGVEDYIKESVAPTDPALSYLAVKGTDGTWLGLLANYSLHYVGDWENGTISADYFGFFADRLRKMLDAGPDFVGMMSNGTSGDVNIWDFSNADRYPTGFFEKSALIGGALAEKVANSIDELCWDENPEIAVAFDELSLKVLKPDEEELGVAAQIVSRSNYENIVVNAEGLRSLYAREQLLLNEFPELLPVPLQSFRIGEGAIGGLPGEFFAETGLKLRSAAAAKHYFTVSMANGNVGYVPPLHEKKKGGYETWRCRYSCLEDDAEEKIRQKLIELINSKF